ncbi:MAG: hypothetical protein ACYDH3_03795 [Candidatus Aminicenantales bacterium]
MMRFLFYGLMAYLLYRLVSFFRKLGQTTQAPPPPSSPSGTMVKDEVCQTYLPREKALRDIIDGEERYFCSQECRQKCLEERKKNR